MATPPFDLDHTAPAPTDLVSSFPANEQSNRDIIESWLTILSDPATGLLKPTAITVPLTLTQAASGTILTLVSTDAGAATGPVLTLHRDSASPAALDIIGGVFFNGEDSAGNATTYSNIYSQITNATDGNEFAQLVFATQVAGVNTSRLTLHNLGAAFTGNINMNAFGQTSSLIQARGPVNGNSFEFGHNSSAGFASTLGHFTTSGVPFLAFFGEHGTTANTIRTRGIPASVIRADALGGFVFANAPTATADNQTPVTLAALSAAGNFTTNGFLTSTVGGVHAGTPTQTILSSQNASGDSGVIYLRPGGYNSSVGEFNLNSAGRLTGVSIDLSGSIQTPTVSLEGATGLLIWEDDPDMWIRRISENNMQFVAGGIQQLIVNTAGLTITNAVSVASTITSTLTGFRAPAGVSSYSWTADTDTGIDNFAAGNIGFNTNGIRRVFIDASGNTFATGNVITVNDGFHTNNKTASNPATVGASMLSSGQINATVASDVCSILNRTSSEGSIMHIRNDNVTEGTISEAGGVVTYGTFFGAHWSQLKEGGRQEILRGTICEHIDEVCYWEDSKYPEPLPKFKISDTPESTRVYGVFSTWDNDDDLDDAYIGGLGTFFIRIDAGETVQGGDWIMSAGNGCGVVMDPYDDPRKHVATVTAAVVSEVYPDGSYLVPCTLHCG